MSEKYFPFDSVNGDRSYLAKDFRKYFKTIITSGVFAGGDNLPVRSAGGLNITVGLGFAWVEGALYEVEGTPLPFALSPGASNPRIDRVVVRLDIAERKVYTTVVQGTPAASPVAPALVRNGDFYDLGLATITVPASAISITNSAIQDTRTNSAVCGVVRSPVEVLDVDAFMVNCQTAFDEWFSNLEEQFSGDVAGNLQNQINAIRNDLDNGVYSTTAVLHLHTVPGAAVTLTFGNVTLSATANAQGLADLYPNKLGTSKYVSKDLSRRAGDLGKHLYFHSRPLKKAENVSNVYFPNPGLDGLCTHEYDFCKTGMVEDAPWYFPYTWDGAEWEETPLIPPPMADPLEGFEPGTVEPPREVWEQMNMLGGI